MGEKGGVELKIIKNFPKKQKIARCVLEIFFEICYTVFGYGGEVCFLFVLIYRRHGSAKEENSKKYSTAVITLSALFGCMMFILII